jgi:hypothetical protein
MLPSKSPMAAPSKIPIATLRSHAFMLDLLVSGLGG